MEFELCDSFGCSNWNSVDNILKNIYGILDKIHPKECFQNKKWHVVKAAFLSDCVIVTKLVINLIFKVCGPKHKKLSLTLNVFMRHHNEYSLAVAKKILNT